MHAVGGNHEGVGRPYSAVAAAMLEVFHKSPCPALRKNCQAQGRSIRDHGSHGRDEA